MCLSYCKEISRDLSSRHVRVPWDVPISRFLNALDDL